jgi:hypothetical protein
MTGAARCLVRAEELHATGHDRNRKVAGSRIWTYKSVMKRPKQPSGAGRKYKLQIRLTEAERCALEMAADEEGKDTATWARFVLLDRAQNPMRLPFNLDGFRQLLRRTDLEPEVKSWLEELSRRWPLPPFEYYREQLSRPALDRQIREFINRHLPRSQTDAARKRAGPIVEGMS